MTIWEVINISDPVTIVTDRFDLAVAATMLIGGGQYALKSKDSDQEMPIFTFIPMKHMLKWFEETFPEKMHLEGNTVYDKFMDSLNKHELADVLRTAQVCTPEERESYQKALEAIDDPERKQGYAKWWKDQRRSSMNDIARRAWAFADRLDELARNEADT